MQGVSPHARSVRNQTSTKKKRDTLCSSGVPHLGIGTLAPFLAADTKVPLAITTAQACMLQ